MIRTLPVSRLSRCLFVMSGVFLLAGCEQMKSPGYYDLPRASTTTDAIRQAESGGTRQVIQAPSQLQFKFSRPASPDGTGVPPDAADSPQERVAAQDTTIGQPGEGARLTSQGRRAVTEADIETFDLTKWIPQPQTYFGTLPCFHQDMRCTNQKVTLTLAPNGRWRARAAYLENNAESGKPLADQGCWRILPTTPPTLTLLDINGNARAEMAFLNRNSLRVRTIDGDTPNLTYMLTRQPDLDPIAELDGKPSPNCNN
ncbi:copper resistance protein NlpE N-terminal domain-containing protein [Orrella marina]|nr:copper resistance protein NlpE N-terminal domain-containing protein [Orrella marina]